MRNETVLIFGAGATKACGGPLTNEILPRTFKLQEFIEREDFLCTLGDFLKGNFHLPLDLMARSRESYPPLPLLTGLVDIAISRKHSLGPAWNADKLLEVRKALDYAIFAVIEHDLLKLIDNHYYKLIKRLFDFTQTPPTIVSLNYDIIVDNTLMAISENAGSIGFPDYGCDIATDIYRNQNKFGKLYKLHGSLNWLYCPACQRLDLGTTKSGRNTVKMLEILYQEEETKLAEDSGGGDLHHRYTCQGSPCRDCRTHVTPVMISPTHLKDYSNPHISQIWYYAERALRKANRVIIAGYSMPWDDIDVIYLFKRGLSGLPASAITVVEMDEEQRPAHEHPVGKNYCKIFGDDIDWHPEGFADFANKWVPN